MAIAVTVVGCGGGTPTSPSQIMPSARTISSDFGDFGFFTTRQLTGSDQTYATSEGNANYALIQFGMLAEQRGDHAQVKVFGRQLVQDISVAQANLGQFAGASVVQGARFDAADQTTYNTLRGLSGSELDRAFVTAIMAELTSTRSSLQSLSAQAPDSAVRAHASAMDGLLSHFQTLVRDLDTYL